MSRERLVRCSWLLPLVFGVLAPATEAADNRLNICFAPGIDSATRTELLRVYDVVAFDHELNMVTQPLNHQAYQQIEDAMEHGAPQVRILSITLLSTIIAQDALRSDADASDLARAVARVLSSPESSPATKMVGLLARRLAWHLQVKALTDASARATVLAPLLDERGDDAPYRAETAVDYLAELGDEGERVLGAFVALEGKRSLDEEILDRAKLALRKIALSRQVELGRPIDVVKALVDAARTPERRTRDVEFRKWAIGELARQRPQADSELKGFVGDQAMDETLQSAAKFALTDDAAKVRWR